VLQWRGCATAIYPGSFDPLTNGHLDIVHRAAKIIRPRCHGRGKNEDKHPLFTLDERFALVKQAVQNVPGVEADAFDGLLINML